MERADPEDGTNQGYYTCFIDYLKITNKITLKSVQYWLDNVIIKCI